MGGEGRRVGVGEAEEGKREVGRGGRLGEVKKRKKMESGKKRGRQMRRRTR